MAGARIARLRQNAGAPDFETLRRSRPRRRPCAVQPAFRVRPRPALAPAARALQQWSGAAG